MNELIPKVPWPTDDVAVNVAFQSIFTVVLAVICVILFALAIRAYFKKGTLIPLLLLISGGIASMVEPIIDVTGLVWFYTDGMNELFTFASRPMPDWLPLAYIFFMGGQSWYTWNKIKEGKSRKDIWIMYGIYFLVNLLLEEPPLHLGLYNYYGVHPFRFFMPYIQLPLWWPMINSMIPILGGVLVFRMEQHFKGWKQFAFIFFVPIANMSLNGSIGWPIWTVINSTNNVLIVNLVACGSLAIAMTILYILSIAGSSAPETLRIES